MTYWHKLPLVLRAILVGLFVSTLGVAISGLVAVSIPMPYSFLVMTIILVLYWRYFSGSWGPESTKAIRKERTRSTTKLSTRTWTWAIIGALLIVLIEQAGLVFTFRLIEFPSDMFIQEYSFLNAVPTWAGWLYIIFISIVAGICEEFGFRGFMQQPIEKKYGPLVAISITSIMFVVLHLHQAWSSSILIHIFLISALFGVLAFYTQSLIPGIVGHFIMDICNFSFWWSDLFRQFDRETIFVTGADAHFVTWTSMLIIASGLFLYTIRIMKQDKKA